MEETQKTKQKNEIFNLSTKKRQFLKQKIQNSSFNQSSKHNSNYSHLIKTQKSNDQILKENHKMNLNIKSSEDKIFNYEKVFQEKNLFQKKKNDEKLKPLVIGNKTSFMKEFELVNKKILNSIPNSELKDEHVREKERLVRVKEKIRNIFKKDELNYADFQKSRENNYIDLKIEPIIKLYLRKLILRDCFIENGILKIQFFRNGNEIFESIEIPFKKQNDEFIFEKEEVEIEFDKFEFSVILFEILNEDDEESESWTFINLTNLFEYPFIKDFLHKNNFSYQLNEKTKNTFQKCSVCKEKENKKDLKNVKTAIYSKQQKSSKNIEKVCFCVDLIEENETLIKKMTFPNSNDIHHSLDKEIEYWQNNYRDGNYCLPICRNPMVTNIHRGYVPNVQIFPESFLYIQIQNIFLENFEKSTNEFEFLLDIRENFGNKDLPLSCFEIPTEHIYSDDFGQKLTFFQKFLKNLMLKKKETEDMMNMMKADLEFIQDYLDSEKNYIDHVKIQQKQRIDDELNGLKNYLEGEKDRVIDPLKKKIDLLEKQLNKLGRVQEKMTVFSKIIRRKGVRIQIRTMYDIFNENDLRLKIRIFDNKKNIIDDFGNICVFSTRRFDSHISQHKAFTQYMSQLKSFYEQKKPIFEDFQREILEHISLDQNKKIFKREEVNQICFELGKNFREKDIVSNKLIKYCNKIFKYINKIPKVSHSSIIDITEDFFILSFIEDILKEQRKKKKQNILILDDEENSQFYIQFILYEILSEPRFKYPPKKGKKFLNSYVMVEDKRMIGHTYLQLKYNSKKRTLNEGRHILNFIELKEEEIDESLLLPPYICNKNTNRETHFEKKWSKEYKYNLKEYNAITCGNNIRDKIIKKGHDHLHKKDFTIWREDLNFDKNIIKKIEMKENLDEIEKFSEHICKKCENYCIIPNNIIQKHEIWINRFIVISKWLSIVLKGKRQKKREIRKEIKLQSNPLAQLKENSKKNQKVYNPKKSIFNMNPGDNKNENDEIDLKKTYIGIPEKQDFSPLSAQTEKTRVIKFGLTKPNKNILEKINENDFIDQNIKNLLKYNERFKVEENLPKLDVIIEGIFYDEDFQIPEFIYMPKKKKKPKDEKNVEVERRPFIAQFENKKFEKDGGFDIYIDGARYLPNSVNVSKIVFRILDSNLKDVIEPITQITNLTCSIYHPVFDFRFEVRLPFYDPSCVLLISLITLDESDALSSKPIILGYSFFPLFLNKNAMKKKNKNSKYEEQQKKNRQKGRIYSKWKKDKNINIGQMNKKKILDGQFIGYDQNKKYEQELSSENSESETEEDFNYNIEDLFFDISKFKNPYSEDIVLMTGKYQIPIFCQEFYQKKPFIYLEQLKLDRLPASSLLIRIKEAKKDPYSKQLLSVKNVPEKKWKLFELVEERPNYHSGCYNTSQMALNESEKGLFEILKERKNIPVIEKAIEIMMKKGLYENLVRKNNEEITNEIKDHLDKLMQIDKETPMIDMKYYSKYNSQIGFKLCVDGLHNIKKKGIFVVLVSLTGNSNLYSEQFDPLTLKFFSMIDWKSPIKSPKYQENYALYKDISYDKSLCFIFDIREIVFTKEREIIIQDFGFTIFPVFDRKGYVNSGIFQLPVYHGQVKPHLLDELKNSGFPWKTLLDFADRKDYFTKKKMLHLMKPSSILIRLIDGQREGHLNFPCETSRMDYSYIPESDLYYYSFNEIIEEELKSATKCETLLELSPLETNLTISSAIINALKTNQFATENKL